MASLSEQLAELADPTPLFKDPEDDINIESSAKLISKDELNEDFVNDIITPSSLRLRNAEILGDSDKVYSGKVVSRKDIYSVEDEEREDETSDSEEDISQFRDILLKQKKSVDDDEMEAGKERMDSVHNNFEKFKMENDSDDSMTGRDNDESDDDSEYSYEDEESESISENSEEDKIDSEPANFKRFSEINVSEELEKGKAVNVQLSLWDGLLESRIKIQKLMTLCNQLPQHNTWNSFIEKADKSSLIHSQTEIIKLMNNLINIQNNLLLQNSLTESLVDKNDSFTQHCKENETRDVKAIGSKKRTLKVSEYEEILSKRFKNFTSFRTDTIQKWSDKTRVSFGKVSNKSFSVFEQSTVKQINQILNDKPRLLRRTQLKRSNFRVLGKHDDEVKNVKENSEEEINRSNHMQNFDPEIFDDSDFYHQLLRELIERKSSDVNNPDMHGRQLLEIQKLRGKIKRKVDTKASKGRRTRFTVHNKLVNFMAPIVDNQMTDEAKNELFSSLFGNKSHKESHLSDTVDNSITLINS